ncbi:hypothetical protein CTAYLR_000058 [Chrysophaeum taylorii]|uniref:RRM domain-containing protein n=1 Tax=Chrysophaeum taylorii TaxID=2483200 RepID=A0AAD7UIZ8_9STRA|nr:hypothetical protein CTAYLR_000058 [Chrysophaeum taylorii]
MGDSSWYYSVDGKSLGPVPAGALLKLVERGVVPESASAWKSGLEKWVPLESALGLGVTLVRSSFYVVAGESTLGPYNLSELRRRFEVGEIDGLSRVWHAKSTEWTPLGEIPELRALLATATESADYDVAAQTFEPQPEMPVAKKRSFRADDGRAFEYDGEQWVESRDRVGDDEEEPEEEEEDKPKKKKKKKKFDKGKCWVYIEGLPSDVTAEEIVDHFKKCGVIASDPETAKPRVKIYQEHGIPKGDGSLCYANAASVDLALQVLDGGSLRFGCPLRVSRAEFSERRLGEYDPSKARRVNAVKVKYAKKATQQLTQWDADETGLRIIVVERAFKAPVNEPELQDRIAQFFIEERIDPPDKITLFPRHPDGIIVVKTKTADDAHRVIALLDGRSPFLGEGTMRCFFWDGVTNYGAEELDDDDDEEGRIDRFGDWLETQKLPPELALHVEK